MKDRIRQIMEYEHLSPSLFADKLGLGRAVISHILNGRNNPSLDVVTRILSKMDYIDPEWLLAGTGDMFKNNVAKNEVQNDANPTTIRLQNNPPDLFSQNDVNPTTNKSKDENRKDIEVEHHQKSDDNAIKQHVIYQKSVERKVSKIIIYYTDNTFETFNADNRPL